ncbi:MULTISPECIES: hypothetical protein [Methanococcoides]|jgi:hypothetical protein|uniref:Uncharacterized protein n=1 Tax=Methanococcoides seepicolus TaxID=2828780 RepID=A0A9E5DB10_9EURY|nr:MULTISPECIES: hypothetical protein [Methanococcoides]MCM1986397.1 hypothetical protein [Methanococcoides seepicolus]NOQ47988.1 hypothetical protein [Methanococcoides sp.]
MPKKLTIEDLEKRKEKIEIEEELGEKLEDLYDIIMPPGTPSYIMYDMIEEFELEPVERKLTVNIVECDERNVIALRGKLEVVKEAEQYYFKEMEEYINSN